MRKIIIFSSLCVFIACSFIAYSNEAVRETISTGGERIDKEANTSQQSNIVNSEKKINMNKAKYSFEKIREEYRGPASRKGSIARLDYKTTNSKSKVINKYAYVYLPNGYDAKDTTTRYNIFYLMHGGSGSPDTWFGGTNGTTALKNVIDQMIERNDIEPTIIVTPTYYTEGNGDSGDSYQGEGKMTEIFQQELVKDLIPAVESKYHTYAKSTDTEGLKASRSHRAFGGYSMGSVTTWYAFIHSLDYFEYFMPMSGDCWIFGMMGGGSSSNKTAEYLHDVASKSGYKPGEYYIYASVGARGVAYEPMKNQIEAMRKYSDTFIDTDNFANGNFHLDIAEDGTHDYEHGYQYIYNSLPSFFHN